MNTNKSQVSQLPPLMMTKQVQVLQHLCHLKLTSVRRKNKLEIYVSFSLCYSKICGFFIILKKKTSKFYIFKYFNSTL
jgi:hypothetical protein